MREVELLIGYIIASCIEMYVNWEDIEFMMGIIPVGIFVVIYLFVINFKDRKSQRSSL